MAKGPKAGAPRAVQPAKTRSSWRGMAAVAGMLVPLGVAALWLMHRASIPKAISTAVADSDLKAAGYVDPAACGECHADVVDTYRRTGMALSFHRPGAQTIIEDFKKGNRFTHAASGLTYTMIERDGKFYQRRSTVGFDGKETNVLEESIDYVVGSGNHARAYLHRNAQGKLEELPVNWYVENGGHWGMSPGFDHAVQPDMHGVVNAECVFCHDAYPLADGRNTRDDEHVEPVALPEGIDCQRCHGPGAAHIRAARAKAGDEDIAKTIVNPGRLSRERQLEVCMQCHLETSAQHEPNSVRKYGRALDSYRPGEPLGDYKIYFEKPRQANDFSFETAHAAYQLPRSACFQKSEMTCLTCHDPRDIPRGQEATDHYIEVCQSCHAATKDLARDAAHRNVAMKAGSNCLTCHMPKRRPEASVHVVLTDHWIERRLPPGDPTTPIAEKPFQQDRTKVEIYYPKPAVQKQADLYLAVAQVNDAGIDGRDNLRTLLDRERPNWPQPYVALGDAYAAAGATDDAITAFSQALDRQPDDYDALAGLSSALFAADRTEEAIGVLKRAAERYPSDDRFLVNLGNIYLKQGRVQQAQEVLTKALIANAESAQARNFLGLAAVQSQDSEHAEENFREALRLDPLQPQAHNNLANLLTGKQQFREAEFEYRRALALDPRYAAAHHGLALLLIVTKRADQAAPELEEAAADAPGNTRIWVDLGDLRSAGGHTQLAAEAYRRALAIDPSQPDANLALATILLKEGRSSEAVPHLTTAAHGGDADVARVAQAMLAQVQR